MGGPGNVKGQAGYYFTVFVCLLASFYYYHFFFNRATVELAIEVERNTNFKLYWAAENRGFSEHRRAALVVTPDQQIYRFWLTDLGKVEQLRLDPIDYPGTALIKRITLVQNGFEPVTLDLEQARPHHHIKDYSFSPDGLEVISGGNDPNFILQPELHRQSVAWGLEAGRYAVIWIAVILVIRACRPLRRDFLWVPVLLSMVLVLVVTMAAVSKRNAHPDEYVHLDATGYYQDHWLPPDIEDPAIEHTYSAYGISRLNNGEIYYLFAGKLSRIATILHLDELFSLRLFNLLLFGCILLYTIRSIPARLVAVPFLLTPQLWYLFSYCVSDAFGLFLCFLAACELVRPNSHVNRLVDTTGIRGALLSMLAVALLLALMFLLKINYYPFIALFFAVVARRIYQQEPGFRKAALVRITVCVLIGLACAGARKAADYYVNGPDREEKLVAMQEKTAHHWYKPSTELHKKHVSMYLKQRGTSLKALVIKHRWFAHSFVSGTGLYGYFTIAAPETYYKLMKWLLVAALAYVCVVVFWRGEFELKGLLLLALMLGIALVGASLHRSWTVDLQAQGRYIFPILPMLGVVLGRAGNLLERRLFNLIVLHLFLLSFYSFLFIALVNIPRQV